MAHGKSGYPCLRRLLSPVYIRYLGFMDAPVPVIDLSKAPGKREAWDRPTWVVYLWALCELVFVTNPFQISSRLRVRMLRLFGAAIGDGVTMRPRLRVEFPGSCQASGPGSLRACGSTIRTGWRSAAMS